MGDAKKKADQQRIDQERGFRAHIAEQLATLYQKRAGILESRLNTEATIAKFRESIRPETAIGSAKIGKLADDMARTLECAQTCCDMAIDDLSDVWRDAQTDPLGRVLPIAATPPRRRELPIDVEKDRIRRAPSIDVDPRDPHFQPYIPLDQVAPEWCASCTGADVTHNGQRTCNLHPRPMPDGGCLNHNRDDVAEPGDTHAIPAEEGK